MKKAVKFAGLLNLFGLILLKDTEDGDIKMNLSVLLLYSIASTDETIDHLETLFETESLKNKEFFSSTLDKLNLLGKKLIRFLESIESQHISKK